MAVLWWTLTVLLPVCLTAPADPIAEDEDKTTTPIIPPVPTTEVTTENTVIEVQEQIYIVSGVLGVFLLILLVISLAAAYGVLSLRNKVRALKMESVPKPTTSTVRRPAALDSAAAGSSAAGPAPRTRPPPRQGRNNQAYVDDDDEEVFGDEVHQRYDQYPDQPSGRREVRAGGGNPAREHDRFHQPMPDQRMPSEERRPQHHDSRYGAGNLARLPKGPSPASPDYDRGGYSAERRSPVHAQW